MPPSRPASSSSSSPSHSRFPARGSSSGSRCTAARGPRWGMAEVGADDVGVVITTHNALPWIEQCLASVEGSLQRSVRGFPTRWRLATEYYYLRKLGPRTELLNGFYGAGFDHSSEREVECVMGACMLVRRAAIDAVGPPDPSFFLFSEEV